MPINSTHKSAGVYTATKDLSAGEGVTLSTSVVGIVGGARRGPVNQRVPVLSPTMLGNTFGKRDPKYGLGLYIARQVSKQTNQLYYVRLTKNAKYSVMVLSVDDPDAVVPQLSLTPYVDADGNKVGVDDPNQLGFLPTDALNDNVIGYFICENPGDWNNEISMQIRSAAPKGLDAVADRKVYDAKIFYIEVFENYQPGSAPIEQMQCTLFDHTDDLGRQYNVSTVMRDESSTVRFIANEYFKHDIDFLTSDFAFMAGGSDGDKLTSDMLAKAYQDYFGDPEEVRVTILVSGGLDDHIVHRGMVLAANNHINCHVIGSVPMTEQTPAKAIRYRRQTLNLNARNMSLYSPHIKEFDEDTGRYIWVPIVGQVAAAYCYTDNNRGSWFAPAGITASQNLQIYGSNSYYDQPARDALAREQINYLRKLPEQLGGGYAIWEAFTLLNTDSAFQQVPIQRMVGYVLEVAHRQSRIGLFDPNDSILRDSLVGMIEKFLEEIRLARGLRTGSTGSAGYKVICDDTNNTNQTIENGDLIIDIILDPTRMTRRLIYRFNINPKGSRSTVI